MTRARRLTAAVVVAAAVVLGGAGSASALPFVPTCKNVPQISDAVSGPANMIDPKVDRYDPKDPSAYNQRAWGGLSWPSYDPGCGSALSPVPTSTDSGTVAIANLGLGGLSVAAAINAKVCRVALNPGTVGLLTPISRITRGIGLWVFAALFAVSLLASATLVLVRDGPSGNIRRAAGAGGYTIALFPLAVMAITWPFVVAPFLISVMQGAVTWTAAATTSLATTGQANVHASAGDACAAAIHQTVYSTWEAGAFGRHGGATAAKYGPALAAAGALNRPESALTGAKADAARTAHQATYGKVATSIQGADAQAYTFLAGHQGGAQIGYVLLGFIGLAMTSWFFIPAALTFLLAMIVLTLVTALFLLVLVVAVFHPARKVLFKFGDYVFGSFVNAIVFGPALIVYLTAMAYLLGPRSSTDPLTAWVLLAVLSYVLTRLTRLRKRFKFAFRLNRPGRGTPPALPPGPPPTVVIVGVPYPVPVGWTGPQPGAGRHAIDGIPAQSIVHGTVVQGVTR